MRDAAELIPLDAAPVILTGEYIPENFLLSCQNGAWRLSGLIDFGDVLTGWGEYDLLGPSAFMTRRNAAARPQPVSRVLDIRRPISTPTLKRRLMALLLLHRASDPIRHICIEGWQDKADDLLELEELLWPI